MVEVCHVTKTATIHRAYLALDFKEQLETLEATTQMESPEDRFELDATTDDEIQLVTITGPDVEPECIPQKYRKLFPEGYRTFLSHQVKQSKQPERRKSSANNSDFTVFGDPYFKRPNYGNYFVHCNIQTFEGQNLYCLSNNNHSSVSANTLTTSRHYLNCNAVRQ